ncbi:MAG TPA: HAMP domain-containing sensor histidine kinase [Pseudonocardiaceae bacterium]|nr:HAMP domain-containing sensor histidine kinase [Pseudonocardiaceae bacterium]
MRTRLLGIAIALVVLVVLGLGVPLGLAIAGGEGQSLFVDRVTDTQLFASLAQGPLAEGQPDGLTDTLGRYQQVYGIQAVVLRLDGTPVAGSAAPPVDLTDPVVAQAVKNALAGEPPTNPPTLLPWDSTPLVVAEPVLVGGELSGVALTVSSTANVRSIILRYWGEVTAGAILGIIIGVLVALALVRWILRPVRQLDDATARLATAVVSGRPVAPVRGAGEGGPPDLRGPPELRRLSRSFDQMTETVVGALAAQRTFVADASHQLRNPLHALLLRLRNMDGQVRAEAVEHHGAAIDQARRFEAILDDLLTMARAQSDTVPPVEVNVGSVVKAKIAEWQVVGQSRDVLLVLDGEPGGLAVAPARGLETMLDALLDNALKFSEPGTAVTVDVRRSSDTAPTVSIAVRDHGPGMRPEELTRATDRFWRSPTHHNVVRGSGLGLAIVARTVERVDGRVQLDLPDGGGLRVTVTLPASDGQNFADR